MVIVSLSPGASTLVPEALLVPVKVPVVELDWACAVVTSEAAARARAGSIERQKVFI